MTRAGRWLRAAALRAHAAMIWLYPRAFAGEFGEEMRADFALSLAEARDWRGAGRVFLREARDWPLSLWAAYSRALRGHVRRLGQTPATPSWPAALLAVVPGLAWVWGYWAFRVFREARPWLSEWMGLLLLGGMLAYAALATLRARRLPVWALPAVGLLVALVPLTVRGASGEGTLWQAAILAGLSCGAAWVLARGGPRLPRWAWALVAGLAALGLARGAWMAASTTYLGAVTPADFALFTVVDNLAPLALLLVALAVGRVAALRYGVAAALVVLALLPVLLDVALDPTYGIRSSPLPHVALMAPVLRTLLYGLPLIVAPAWLLRSRTALGQAHSVLRPAALMLVVAAAFPAWYFGQWVGDVFVLGQVGLAALAAVGVFGALGAPIGPTVTEH